MAAPSTRSHQSLARPMRLAVGVATFCPETRLNGTSSGRAAVTMRSVPRYMRGRMRLDRI